MFVARTSDYGKWKFKRKQKNTSELRIAFALMDVYIRFDVFTNFNQGRRSI